MSESEEHAETEHVQPQQIEFILRSKFADASLTANEHNDLNRQLHTRAEVGEKIKAVFSSPNGMEASAHATATLDPDAAEAFGEELIEAAEAARDY